MAEKEEKLNEEQEEKQETLAPKPSVEEKDQSTENKKQEETEEKDETTEEKQEEKTVAPEEEEEDEMQKLQYKVSELNDKYMRLSAEFDNYRKRTLKEKGDLLKTASEDVLVNLLPVIDNFERALKSMENAKDVDAVKEGVSLIYTNFKDFLSQRGVKEIDAMSKKLDTDLHDAVTKIPAPKKKLKGKVVDVIEKGYLLHDKVIRFSKVVIGE